MIGALSTCIVLAASAPGATLAATDAKPAPKSAAASKAGRSGKDRRQKPAAEEPSAPERFLVPEPYATSGFAFFSSDRRLIAGLGGGLGMRLALGSHLLLHAEARGITFVRNAFTFAGGASYRFNYRGWEPFIGAQYAGYVGDKVEVVTSSQPDLPPPYAWAIQMRAAPLRFVRGPWTAAALAFDAGFGDDAGTRAFALSIGFLELGYRL